MSHKGKNKEVQNEGDASQTNLASTSHSSPSPKGDKAYEETRDAFILGFNVVREVSEATNLLAPLRATCLLLVRGLEMTRSININQNAWDDLSSELKLQLAMLEDYQQRLDGHPCNLDLTPIQALEQYVKSLKNILAGVIDAKKKAKKARYLFKRLIRADLDVEEIADRTRSMDAAYRRFTDAMKILQWLQSADQTVMIKGQTAMLEDQSLMLKNHETMIKEHGATMRKIRDAVKQFSAATDTPLREEDDEALLEIAYGFRLDICHEGTRTAILDRIWSWIAEEKPMAQIFWLHDVAGTGKSTIAATVADRCLNNGQLAGRFFFSPNSEATSSLKIFCETVAKDMAAQIPSIRPALEDAINDSQSISAPFHQKFKKILIDPLSQADEPVVFVFDALDNCDVTGHRTLIQFLLKHLPSIPMTKVFLTSRPLTSIRILLEPSPMVTGHDIQLYSPYEPISNPDITIYVNQHYNFHYLTQDQRTKLVARSKGLFLWAATACRLFQGSRQYDELLSMLLGSEYGGDMDMLYLGILKRARIDRRAHRNFMNVLQIIITAVEPLSISTIEIYLPKNRLVNTFIQDLCSVVKDGDPHRPIHVIHPTFREFLTQSARANGFLVEPFPSHSLLAMACLTCLLDQLRYDIAGLHKPRTQPPHFNYKTRGVVEAKLHRSLFDALLYASKHWAFHVIKSIDDPEVTKALRRFLNTKVLNWMEFLSLCQLVTQGLGGLLSLSEFVQNSVKSANSSLVPHDAVISADALRFMQRHQRTIGYAALQIYRSALSFTPQATPIYQKYHAEYEHTMPEIIYGMSQSWEPYLPLNGHSRGLSCAAFSPDGKLIASGGIDGTVRIWDSSSGAWIQGEFRYFPAVYEVLFTPDGQTVVASGYSNDLVIYDAPTGSMKEIRLVGHEKYVTAMAVAPDSIHVVSSSEDMTIRFWELGSGECQSVVQSDHKQAIDRLAYSPNGSFLASTSGKQLTIWDTVTRTSIMPSTEICAGDIETLSFMPNGTKILCGSKDASMYLINVDQPHSISTLPGNSGGISCCAVLPDSSRIAAGANDGVVMIWDVQTLLPVFTALKGHSRRVTTIAFTPNGSQLITLSWDDTARLWDIATGNHTIGILESSDNWMSSAAISPDATRFITGYRDGNLLLWSVSDDLFGAGGRVKAHSADIYCLSISLDLKRVASASIDGTIRFWDASTGQSQGDAVVAHESRIQCIEFSSDGKYLASGSDDCTARVWDAATGLLHTQPLQHHLKPVGALAFSRNTEYLATGSQDQTIGLWNVNSGQLVGKMIGHSHFITALAFLDELGRIISGTPNGELKQWSFPSCEELTNLAVKCDKTIESMVVSPDGKDLALIVGDDLEIWKLVPEWKKVTMGLCNIWLRATNLYFDPSGRYVWVANNIWEVPADPPRIARHAKTPPHPLSRLYCENNGLVAEMTATTLTKGLFQLPEDISISRWLAFGDKIMIACHSGAVWVIDCERLFKSVEVRSEEDL